MMLNLNILILILVCSIVTWIPRILPFAFAQKLKFPPRAEIFLSYLPLCILFALLIQSLLNFRSGNWPTIKGPEVLASIPALMVGYYTKDLMKIVIVGIVAIALIRLVI